MNRTLKYANAHFMAGDLKEAYEAYAKISAAKGDLGDFARANSELVKKIATAKGTVLDVDASENGGRGRGSSALLSSRKFVGIASIPQRSDCLEKTIESLIDQVDKIGIFLDGYTEVPNFLIDNPKIVVKRSQDFDKKIGDAGKFYWVTDFDGYYFVCDDDLQYPENYMRRLIERIEHYKYEAVVGWHGGLIKSPFSDYYDSESRRVFTFSAPRPYDTPVHVLGTGCLGFHSSTIRASFEDFPTANMADIYFARLGQEQSVPFLVMEHSRNEILEIESSQEFSIYQHSAKEVTNSHHNTKAKQNDLVKAINWNVNYVESSLELLVFGRFKINSKGGINKSSRLLVDAFRSLGHQVTDVCLSDLQKGEFSVGDKRYDFALIYAPDPNRPDFGDTLALVKALAEKGTKCAVNFSFNLDAERTSWIDRQIRELNKPYDSPMVYIAAFTNSTKLLFSEDLHDLIVRFPKTIDEGKPVSLGYHEREGIFIGDLAKLFNQNLVGGDYTKWLEQIRIQLPHVNIYALKHYHTDLKPLSYIKVLPYTKNLDEMLGKFRVAVCLTKGATFEMVPVEAQSSGTPVVHQFMPQSLSEYLSPASIEVNSPKELGLVVRNIYERKEIWDGLNRAGAMSSSLYNIKNISASLDLAIRQCLKR